MASSERGSKRQVRKPVRYVDETTSKKATGNSARDPLPILDDDDEQLDNEVNDHSNDDDGAVGGDRKDQDYRSSDHEEPSNTKQRKNRGPNYLYLKLDALRELHGKLREDNKGLSGDNTKLRKKNAEINKSLANEQSKSADLQKKWDKAQREIIELKASLSQQLKQHSKDMREHARVEQVLQAKIESDQYQSLPDDVVRYKLKSVRTQCNDWVKEWQSRGNTANMELIWNKINSLCINPDISGMASLLKTHIEAMDNAGTKLICMALLTRYVLDKFFRHPFELFRKHEHDVSVVHNLTSINNMFASGDMQKAVAWRAETMRCFKGLLQNQTLSSEDLKTHPDLVKLCKSEANKIFENLYCHRLLKDLAPEEKEKALNALTNIHLDVAVLSLELWSRRLDVEVVSAKELYEEPFSIKSHKYDPHPAMCLDDDDDSLDGRSVQIVVLPMIKALGPMRRDGSREELIWAPAQVMIFTDLHEDNPGESNHLVEKQDRPKSRRSSSRTVDKEREPNAKRQKTEETHLPPSTTNKTDPVSASGSQVQPKHSSPLIARTVENFSRYSPFPTQQVPVVGKSALQGHLDSINQHGMMYEKDKSSLLLNTSSQLRKGKQAQLEKAKTDGETKT